MNITNNGGLLFAAAQVLGHLMDFGENGVYEPTIGKVDVDPKDVTKHNETLDNALISGLDANCKVGQCGQFYFCAKGSCSINTFTGKLVSDRVTKNGKSITFTRDGKTYRGRMQKNSELFNFKRIS